MNLLRDLLSEIEAYIGQRRMSATAFGIAAMSDGKFVARLRDGKGITVRSVERVRRYMADHPVEEAADEEPAETQRRRAGGSAP